MDPLSGDSPVPSSPSILKKQKVDFDESYETKVEISEESDGESGGESGCESGSGSDGESHIPDFAREFMETNYSVEERAACKEACKRYRAQVKASDGFDVDDHPNVNLFGQITPILSDKISGSGDYASFIKNLAILALEEYNKDKEEHLIFDRIEKGTLQLEIGPVYRITFLVKDASLQSKVFQAKVGVMGPTKKVDVKFCRPKP